MTRLPQPGSDAGQWGDILNDYLSQSHNNDGSLKDISQTKITNLVTDLAGLQSDVTQANTNITSALTNKADVSALTAHTSNTANPHAITKAQVGLANVDNTTDLSKPISTATQTALNAKADTSALTTGLASKANTSSLASVATTGNYSDLTNKPTIPSQSSDIGAQSSAGLDTATSSLVTASASATRGALDAVYSPLPTGTPDIGNIPTVSTVTPLALTWTVPSGGAISDATLAAMVGTATTKTTLDATYAKRRTVAERIFDIRDYGAKVDGKRVTGTAMSLGGSIVSGYTFVAGDVGKIIAVLGAGRIGDGNDGVLVGTIQSVNSGAATISATAVQAVSGAVCIFGTADDTAIASAQTAAVAAGGGTVQFPAGTTVVAGTSLNVQNYVSWAGVRRELSIIRVLKVGTGSTGSADWLTCSGRDTTTYLIGAHFHDFTLDGEAMAHATAYNSSIKPLNIYYVDQCSIERVNVLNSPATAIPFDHSKNQVVIRDNYVFHPGRLAPSTGPGGSGIGVGTRGVGATDPTLISGNVIIGTQTSTVRGFGHNGIFVEAQSGSSYVLGTFGYRIVNNIIQAMPQGISETGANGTIISGNVIAGCGRGIRLSYTSLTGSYPGIDTMITGNTIVGSTGPTDSVAEDGQGICVQTGPNPSSSLTSYTNVTTSRRLLIHGNKIINCLKNGIQLLIDKQDLADIKIDGNMIHRCGYNGIIAQRTGSATATQILQMSIVNNTISENGTAVASTARQTGVYMATSVAWVGGRLQDNDIYDLQATPTQTATYSFVVATSGVRVAGNTGDA